MNKRGADSGRPSASPEFSLHKVLVGFGRKYVFQLVPFAVAEQARGRNVRTAIAAAIAARQQMLGGAPAFLCLAL